MGKNITLLARMKAKPPWTLDDPQEPKRGILPDLLGLLESMAAQDGYKLTIITEEGKSCKNFDSGPTLSPECDRFDLMVGSQHPSPHRLSLVDLTPPIMQTFFSASRYIGKDGVGQSGSRTVSSFAEANRFGSTICSSANDEVTNTLIRRYPNAKYILCTSIENCIPLLKNGTCSLLAGKNYNLDYASVLDPTLLRTREVHGRTFITWPINYKVDPEIRSLIKRWTYMATTQGNAIEEIFKKYLDPHRCPLGFAGDTCEDLCDPDRGISDSHGKCICDSTKWIGDDCSVEVFEDSGLISTWQRRLGYAMFGFNLCLVAFCGVWLVQNRSRADVKVAQPLFLGLVLVGCLISSSTILALMQESEDDKSSSVLCMLIPWLYSIGFSITFGTLFTKIVRVHMLVRAASNMRRVQITWQAALRWIFLVLLADVLYLALWQSIDPLKWRRNVITADKFGNVLSSSGTCTSEHLEWFGGILLSFHIILMGWGSYVCYATRMIPEQLSGARSTSIAMVSNFQIIVVGLPMILLVGSDPDTSFILRSTLLWMNDMVVVLVIFGNLMFFRKQASHDSTPDEIVRSSIRGYMISTSKNRSRSQNVRHDSHHDSNLSFQQRQCDNWQDEAS